MQLRDANMTVVVKKEKKLYVAVKGVTHSEKGKFLKGHHITNGGRPHKSRDKLGAAFVDALSRDFDEYGEEAIVACRMFAPDKYLALIAHLMPKEVRVSHEEQMTDGELESALKRLLFADVAATLSGETAGPATIIEGEATTISEEQAR
jgi:hypothetical protein